jgi:8-oxo-dGTP pyrophosphatase MutT (NUDIX family)
MKWKVLESKYLHKEPWLTVREDRCEIPNGNEVPKFYVIEYPEWVNAFCVTKEGQVLLVKQYRHGTGTVAVELPGGVAEEGETMEEAVRREVVEETGYEFPRFEYLGKISANPSTTNNYTHMYLATEGEKVREQKLDETEDVEVLLRSIDEVKEMMKGNQVIQSLHLNTMMYALMKLGKLNF